MSELVIEVERRAQLGRNVARKLARRGQIAAVVYGAGKDSVPITVDRHSLLHLLKTSGTEHPLFLLKMAGTRQQRHAMVREMQVNPVTGQILHIDFQRVLMDEKIKVGVPVELLGTPEGVKNEGGLLDFITREVEVECLPGDIPRVLEVDVSGLHIGQHVEAKDLVLPPEVALAVEPERVLASVAQRRVVEEVAVEAEAAEEEELLTTAEPEEPEVIRRGKGEEEGEES